MFGLKLYKEIRSEKVRRSRNPVLWIQIQIQEGENDPQKNKKSL